MSDDVDWLVMQVRHATQSIAEWAQLATTLEQLGEPAKYHASLARAMQHDAERSQQSYAAQMINAQRDRDREEGERAREEVLIRQSLQAVQESLGDDEIGFHRRQAIAEIHARTPEGESADRVTIIIESSSEGFAELSWEKVSRTDALALYRELLQRLGEADSATGVESL